jgi:hypothetical protein
MKNVLIVVEVVIGKMVVVMFDEFLIRKRSLKSRLEEM